LSGLSRAAIARFSRSLDGRICRLCLSGRPSRGARTKQGLGGAQSDAGMEDRV
jgi:hypothetical protein